APAPSPPAPARSSPSACRLPEPAPPSEGAIKMKPLLKTLMGNGSRDQETLESVRTALAEIQKERERYEALVEGAKAGADRLKSLGEPLARTESDLQSMLGRMTHMEERFAAMVKLSDLFQNLDERAEGLTK